jgi:hypothetical protein
VILFLVNGRCLYKQKVARITLLRSVLNCTLVFIKQYNLYCPKIGNTDYV